MTDDQSPDETTPGGYGLSPNEPVPDSSPGRHSREEDADTVSPADVPSADGTPSVHSDVWVAPPSSTPAGPPPGFETPQYESAQYESPQYETPQYESAQYATPAPVPQPAERASEFAQPEPIAVGATPQPVGTGTIGGSMSEILDTGPTPAQAATPQPKSTGRKSSERRLAYWLIAPAAIVMALVTGYPILYAFWLSLNKATLTAPDEQEFVGLSNYATVLSDGIVRSSVASRNSGACCTRPSGQRTCVPPASANSTLPASTTPVPQQQAAGTSSATGASPSG